MSNLPVETGLKSYMMLKQIDIAPVKFAAPSGANKKRSPHSRWHASVSANFRKTDRRFH
jgi:hypothetical protein